MLETPKERAELLKKGIAGNKIEELYIPTLSKFYSKNFYNQYV